MKTINDSVYRTAVAAAKGNFDAREVRYGGAAKTMLRVFEDVFHFQGH